MSPAGQQVVLLGPQRQPTLDDVVQSLDLEGPFATITAGWQEREPDDAELDALLDGESRNLSLYARWLDVLERDHEYAEADRRLRVVLEEVQELYLLRLDHAMTAVADLQRRPGSAVLREAVVAEAVAAVRELDAAHLVRIGEVNDDFYDRWPPHERPVIAHHRDAVVRLLSGVDALVVAGGHVGVLVAAMHLFNVAAGLDAPVIAWSAGAMALAQQVVLFHDRAARGPGNPEVYGAGLSLLRGVLPLPHATARLLLADMDRMAAFARRFAPDRCVLLDAGSRVDLSVDDEVTPGLPVGTRILAPDGAVAVVARS